jgi:hypothetical protein
VQYAGETCDDEVQMSSSWVETVAVLAAVMVAAMTIFQILLAAGLPLGRAAFGGENQVLPVKLRFVSAIAVFVFLAAFCIILARGGLIGAVSKSSSLTRVGIWILVIIFGLSTLANFSSRSYWERRLMAPVALVLTVCCVTLALA